MSSGCKCGDNCSCGDGCNCNSYDAERVTSGAVIISGVAPAKMEYERFAEKNVEGDGDGCGCGKDCSCGDNCTC